MDVLHRLFLKATRDGFLRKMKPDGVKFQCSLYADDVILFIRPTTQEATAVKEILNTFGAASWLHTNLAKCSITLIYGCEVLGASIEHESHPEVSLPISSGGCRVKNASVPWRSDGQKRKTCLDQVSPSCHAHLCYDGGKLTGMGEKRD
jgi:hypothetical protein